jgi:nucleotide-binding universal stress UspA family protein
MFQFKNILYPIDLDSANISPVLTAIEIAKNFNSSLHILYVNHPDAGYRYPTLQEEAVALRVEEIAAPELLNNVSITYSVSKGDLAAEITDYCMKNSIDLIITGHKHRNKLYSMLFDSPDENIIDKINLPVLVIPKK